MDTDVMMQSKLAHSELTELGFESEVALPDLSRLDYWHPDERLCIEVKHEPPSMAHIFQVNEIQTRLNALGVSSVEYQLWYPATYETEVEAFCKATGFDMMATVAGFVAMLVLDIEDEDVVALNKARSKAQSVVEVKSPPGPFPPDHTACQHCGYADFCHISPFNEEDEL
jgi:CRISPR/Cas system-associated exonuclease Cas4 (RecB family)